MTMPLKVHCLASELWWLMQSTEDFIRINRTAMRTRAFDWETILRWSSLLLITSPKMKAALRQRKTIYK